MNIYNVRKPNITVESTLNLLRVCFSLFVIVVILNIFCACFHPSVTGSSSSRSVRRLFSACCLSKSLFHILQRNLQSKAPNKFGIFVFFFFSFPFCFVFFFALFTICLHFLLAVGVVLFAKNIYGGQIWFLLLIGCMQLK